MPRAMAGYLIVGVLTALVAVGAGTAQAAEPHYFIVEEKYVETKSVVVEGSGTTKIEGVLNKVKVTVKCGKAGMSGSLEGEGKSTNTFEYKECKLLEKEKELTGCQVAEPLVFNKAKGAIIGKEENESELPVEYKLTAHEGTELTKIKITEKEKGKCAETGTYSVLGSQICKLPSGEEELKEHEVECAAGGSKLTIGGEKATITGTDTIKVEGGKLFAFVQQPMRAFNWRVGGAILGSGVKREMETMGLSSGKATIEGVKGGVSFKFECATMKSLQASPLPSLEGDGRPGNNPGKMLVAQFEFEGCNNNVQPANCTVANFNSEPLTGYIVEGISPAGRYVVAFRNATHKLMSFAFAGAACTVGTVNVVERRSPQGAGLLGEMEATERVVQKVKFEPAEPDGGLEARIITGVRLPAGMAVSTETANRVTLKGTLTAELVSGEAFRPE
jgi:hypothetical protein